MASMASAPLVIVLMMGLGVTLQGCWWPWPQPPSSTTTSTSLAPTGPTTTTSPSNSSLVDSPFEKYADEYPDVCYPRLFRSTCSDEQYKGLVLLLHGYSACASQWDGFAPLLNSQCLDVAAPTFPGHGKAPIHNCNAPGAKCTVRWAGNGGNMGFDLSEVPTHSSQYFDFVNSMVQLVKRERDYRAQKLNKSPSQVQLSIGGLSTGGALSAYANSKHPGVFSHMLLINPYFGAGDPAVDEKMRHLAVTRIAEAGVLKTLEPTLALVSDYPDKVLGGTNDKTLHKDITDGMGEVTAWDSDCANIFNKGRDGFCAFQGKHGAAAHSVGMHALVESVSEPVVNYPLTQIITTEQDGMTNNGWTYSLGKDIYKSDERKVAMCMYRFKPGVDRSNPGQYYNSDNVVPHANIDTHDNPSGMWWKDNLFGQMVSFLSGSSVIQSSQTWDHTREQCVGIPFGPGAFGFLSWHNEALLTGITPTASDLGTDGLQSLLNFDNAVRIPCYTPLVKSVLSKWVDCSALGRSDAAGATEVQV